MLKLKKLGHLTNDQLKMMADKQYYYHNFPFLISLPLLN